MSKTKVTRSIVLEEETWQWLDEHARQEGRSASAVVRIIIADYRDRWGLRPEPVEGLRPPWPPSPTTSSPAQKRG